jgi:cation transport ATPase
LVYFPDDHKRHQSSRSISEEWKVSLTIAGLCLAHLALSFMISLGLLSFVGGPADHRWTNMWAGFLGVLSMVLAGMQYFPQIWKTWKRKEAGALSMPDDSTNPW